jgi:hypothetical protein
VPFVVYAFVVRFTFVVVVYGFHSLIVYAFLLRYLRRSRCTLLDAVVAVCLICYVVVYVVTRCCSIALLSLICCSPLLLDSLFDSFIRWTPFRYAPTFTFTFGFTFERGSFFVYVRLVFVYFARSICCSFLRLLRSLLLIVDSVRWLRCCVVTLFR